MEGRTGGYCAKCLKSDKDCTCLHDFFERTRQNISPAMTPAEAIEGRWNERRKEKQAPYLTDHNKDARPATKNHKIEEVEEGIKMSFEFEDWVTPEERENILIFMQGY